MCPRSSGSRRGVWPRTASSAASSCDRCGTTVVSLPGLRGLTKLSASCSHPGGLCNDCLYSIVMDGAAFGNEQAARHMAIRLTKTSCPRVGCGRVFTVDELLSNCTKGLQDEPVRQKALVGTLLGMMETLVGDMPPTDPLYQTTKQSITAGKVAFALNLRPGDPTANGEGAPVQRGTGEYLTGDLRLPCSDLFYCGRSNAPCRCGRGCDGTCGPSNGCQCMSCRALTLKSREKVKVCLPTVTKKVEPVKGNCPICMDDGVDLVQATSSCAHPPKYCKSCIVNVVREGIMGKGAVETIECPDRSCKKYMSADDVLNHTQDDKDLNRRADAAFFTAWTVSQPDFRWCANKKGCGNGVSVEGSQAQFFICSACSSKTCIKHKTVWHPGMTCDQYDEHLRSAADEAFVDANFKRCPKCSVPIEKTKDSCNVVRCCMYGADPCKRKGKDCNHGGRCGHGFCWICLGTIDPDGTRHHKPSCMYNA